ncbi:MAG: helix-turn-helix transcriptional regulator [Pseudonocardiaceae bacterium]
MGWVAAEGGELLEREGELAGLDEVIRAGVAGEGGVVLVEGPAGIGKTSLLGQARRRAVRAGMGVVAAQGAVLERDFGFGVVRQLFEPLLVSVGVADRTELLAGAAALATPVVLPAQAPGAPAGEQAAVLHGLYWLTANVAERCPLLVAVDDVQWADRASVQFLLYVLRRLEGLPLVMVIALRTGEPPVDGPLMAELASHPEARVVRPRALSVVAVAAVVRARLGAGADDTFVTACHAASGGVPFLVRELIGALADEQVAPLASAVARVAELGPRTVAHATALRLSRLSVPAVSVARAVAVLDRHARLDRIATLAGVDTPSVRAAVDTMMAMELLAPDMPVHFAHPLVHRAVYDDIPPAARADAHRRAARLLAEERAPSDEVAAHLLVTDAVGEPATVDLLRDAAAQALARGVPETAIAYLRRAVRESPAVPVRAVLLHELGQAEHLAADEHAIETLTEARRLSDDPVARVRIANDLSKLVMLIGDWTGRVALLRAALAELGDRDLDLAARVEGSLVTTGINDPRFAADFESKMARLRTLLEATVPGTRDLALAIAAAIARRWTDHSEVPQLVEQGLDEGRFLRDAGSESLILPQGIGALVFIDALDAAEAAAAGVLDDARRRSSVLGYGYGYWYRGWLCVQRGALKPAEADYRIALGLAIQNGWTFGLPSLLHFGVDVFLERPQLADLALLAETTELDDAFAQTASGAYLLMVRGRLRMASGRRAAAVEDLRAAGVIWAGLQACNPIEAPWRSALALALPGEALDEARELVAGELRDATATGLTRCQGVALRAAGLLEGGAHGIELLEESLRRLEGCPSTLERARSQVELGAALRRADHRSAARERLRSGLELAVRSGAERLAQRALDELRIAGARPRSRVISGPDALTASEERVARMAAEGMSNREIAQALFVTAKTVENQLGSVYRKLGVSSRRTLAAALTANT